MNRSCVGWEAYSPLQPAWSATNSTERVQAGFLMYLPVYKNGATCDTVDNRRANIIGWVYSPFRMNDLMTGLHGVHVLAGMAAIGWILARARRGEFGPDYFSPVDFTGLYWHLVDLVWIFLFPVLYLI